MREHHAPNIVLFCEMYEDHNFPFAGWTRGEWQIVDIKEYTAAPEPFPVALTTICFLETIGM